MIKLFITTVNIKNFESNEVHCLVTMTFLQDFLILATAHNSSAVCPYLDEQQGCGFCFSLGEWHSYPSVLSFQDDCGMSFLSPRSLSCVLNSWIMRPLRHASSSTRVQPDSQPYAFPKWSILPNFDLHHLEISSIMKLYVVNPGECTWKREAKL